MALKILIQLINNPPVQMDQGISYLILKMFTVMCFFQAERRVLINDQQQAISLYTQFLAAAIHRLFKQHAWVAAGEEDGKPGKQDHNADVGLACYRPLLTSK